MRVYTIGFAKKSAEEFFTQLEQPGLVRVVDIRRSNTSQLAAFTKRDDLRYFLRVINGIDYLHMLELAPTQEILDTYRKHGRDWDKYEHDFLELLAETKVENSVPKEVLDGACLLCSEPSPQHCHRRLVAEYLREHWGDFEIVHL